MDRQEQQVACLIERGRVLRCEGVPGEHRQAVGYVRRLAWTVSELLELLVAAQCLSQEP
ncbi:DUF6415 family natural product biosynthesis protein [Streptomyces sp. ALI-76-A]|uniref:DUF6415 family natural product biosynthesis protein n=1 Tax=Streptomyces sp. ALI-76-A TaxID=3025736 RepID=UPI00256EFD89|nr:DUF6415 family natural product biosynthesis protein [Streptomyces sp. ALI-76-A]MDL5206274.1 DUF6415 family natural product biosynthesis protein [Streptomyces sp. ALI-76-A]